MYKRSVQECATGSMAHRLSTEETVNSAKMFFSTFGGRIVRTADAAVADETFWGIELGGEGRSFFAGVAS